MRFKATAVFGVTGIVLAVGFIISVGVAKFERVVRLDHVRLRSWLSTASNDVVEMQLRPMPSPTKGPATIQQPLTISDQPTLIRLSQHLHSRSSRTSFLGAYGHWADARYARLEVMVKDLPLFVFGLAWHESGDVCGFGLLRDPTARRYSAGNMIDIGASASLASDIDRLVATSAVAWVEAYDGDF